MSREEAIRTVSELYDSWYSVLVRYAGRLFGDSRAAEDVVQESFLELFRQLATGKRIDNPKAWTFCVVRREMSREIRLHASREISLDDSPLFDLETAPAGEGESADFERMMRQLSRREEEVVLLRLESMTYREIAGELGITASTVNTLLARALKKLRAYLEAATVHPVGRGKETPVDARRTLQ